MKTSTKILCIIVPAVALTIIVAGIINYRAARREVQTIAEAHLNEVSGLMAREVSASLKSMRNELAWIARHPGVMSMEWDQMSDYLSDVTEHTSERLTNLMVIEPDGSYYFAGQGRIKGFRLNDRRYFTDIMGGETFAMTDPDLSRSTGKKKYTLAVPIGARDGQVAGILASNISLNILSSMLTETNGPDDGFRWVVDSRGYVIGAADRSLLLEFNLNNAAKNSEGLADLMTAIGQRRRDAQYVTLGGEREYLATCQPISGTPGWALVSGVRAETLTAISKGMTMRIVTALCIAVVVMIGAVGLIMRKAVDQ